MRLILFPGLGANHRLFEKLRVPGCEIVSPDYPDPQPGQSLPEYARELGEKLRLPPTAVIGGASFGGMVAAEIAAQRGAAGLILIGSALHPSEIPTYLKWFELLARPVPNACIGFGQRYFRPLGSAFGRVPPEDRDLYVDLGRHSGVTVLRRGARMIFAWEGRRSLSLPVFRIHGSRDGIIRQPSDPACERVDGGGHLIMLTHAPQVSAFLKRSLDGLKKGTSK